MKRSWLTVAMIMCVLGGVCAGISLHNYFKIQRAGIVEGSFCSITEYINCDVIEASSYSAVKGVPIAGLGLTYYIILLIFLAVARFSKGFNRSIVAFSWWMTCFSILYSLFLFYVAAMVIHALCLTCIGMYIANIMLFVSLYLAMEIPLNQAPQFLWGYWWTVITRRKTGIDFMPKFGSRLLAAAVMFAIGLLFVSSAASTIKKPGAVEIADYVNNFYRQSKYDIKFDKENSPVWGAKGAPVMITEFSDFMCPFCKLAAFSIRPYLAEYKGKVVYYFLNYPLDSNCNHYMEHQMHNGACVAAKASICANELGKFWEYHDHLFKSKGQITMQYVVGLARKLKIDEGAFVECMDSVEAEKKLQDDIEAARRIYVTGTPSVFLNDRQLKFWRSPDVLRTIVDKEIELSTGQRN